MAEQKPWTDGLLHFGDPRTSWRWKTGDVDYVSALRLTTDDAPELLKIATSWAGQQDWDVAADDWSPYAPVHAWRALAQLRAASAVRPLLALLDMLEQRHDDWYLQEFPKVFAWIGKPALPALREYLADDAHRDFPRACAAHGLRDLAAREPALADQAAAALVRTLARFEDNSVMLNSFLARYLLDMRADQAAELVQRAAKAGKLDPDITGQWSGQ